MELYIRIKDGMPFEHPIMGDNFRQAFPNLDPENLPYGFAKFERVPMPYKCGPYEVEYETYEWDGTVVKDVWHVRDMTDEEKAVAVQQLTDLANNRILFCKETADQKLAAAKTDAARQIWVDYKASVEAVTWTDPADVTIPWPPMIDENGNVISTNSSGSAPNVIG